MAPEDVCLLTAGLCACLVKVRVVGDLLGEVAAITVVAVAAAKLLLRRRRLEVVVQLCNRVGEPGGVPGTAQPSERISDAGDAG